MAAKITLKLSNRSPKQPIKKLPETIEVPADATVEEVKHIVARKAGFSDFNRVGLFDPSTQKTLKNRKAQISSEPAVMSAGHVLVKDLGPQLAWSTVFVIEYLGPILIHLAVVSLRPYIYSGPGATKALSPTQLLTLAMFLGHFLKREYETLFVHKFSANTMPLRNIFKNSFFYWAFAGLLSAWHVYSPSSPTALARNDAVDVLGTIIFLFGEASNAIVHLNLASLRSHGGTERQIPRGYGFSLVTCPNYMFEIISWIGVIITSRSWAVAVFIAIGAAQMAQWAKGKERAYRKEFPETYKKKKFVLLPGIF
ncbi:3-oxo-5-alpha-steroid 4-dehydrogenase [Colletotrichum higginsianum]|uniref:very-long-chain enoyl-CoA reductase n=3 Tax=Colletotrichum destructivum species complex TaxID=2707350 RepID=H1V9I8_COLHI|nr:3-oxo-5-alpha-steroid 4-dehydrogenase [Colletotrichum higginsianum IMI 349063]OBR06293.1 3-oxo-5-alpha-steroid 4-dehydrogenase [Colletotrichum higginsianum IMI 349063]TIC97102.1 putative enoyl reductase [Colletotrichum higginsianum]GJD04177.1 3-oxo-5-alpha-steroid 4-dehydrogenase [Colletotrichum higginsianum]CCF36891.1 3-oxo-5-alpha-steroid 4-dehydrogenase [Colletotrichum higginsianum]